MTDRIPESHQLSKPRAGTRGSYEGDNGLVDFTVKSVEGNLCYAEYDNGTVGPFIWRFHDGLNNRHDWPGKDNSLNARVLA